MKAAFAGVLAAVLGLFGIGTTTAVHTTPILSVPTSPVALPLAGTQPAPVHQTIINQPIIERIVSAAGVSQSSLTTQLQVLRDDLVGRIATIAVPAYPLAPATFQALALSQRIDQLTGTVITNPNITGGTITGTHISADSFSLSGVLTLASAIFDSLTAAVATITSLTATNATTTNATSTNLYSGSLSLGSALAVSSGGTGGTSASGARANLGLSYATSADITQDIYVAAWGDSLTSGSGGGGTTYEIVLSNLSGYTVYNGGVGGDTSTQIATRMLAATDKHSWPTIIWAGRNNYFDPTTVKADIASMVDALNLVGNNDYIVLGVLNNSNEASGTTNYDTLIALNSALSATYGSHYLDVRTFLVHDALADAGLTPTAQDIIDIGDDVIPTQLRYDSVHLAATGYVEVARYISQNVDLLRADASTRILRALDMTKLFSSPIISAAILSATSTASSFTGMNRMGLTVRDNGLSNYAGIDFGLSGTNSSNPAARISAIYSPQGSSLQFGTSNLWSSGITNTAMTIDKLGNIGIGTTTPTGRLEVLSTQWNSSVVIGNDVQNTYPGLRFYSNTGSNSFYPFYITEGAGGTLAFKSSGSATQKGSETVTTKLVIAQGGNVGVGTTTPYSRLTIWGFDTTAGTAALTISNSASTTAFQVFNNGNATLSGTLTQNSDQRLKSNIQPLDASSTLALIDELAPVTFTWLDPDKNGAPQFGFIAQDVQGVFPELVSTTSATTLTPDGTLGLNYLGLIAPLVKGVQALIAEVATIETTIAGFADRFTTKNLCVQKSDGTPFCVTGDQLAGVLSGSTSSQISDTTPPASAPDTEAPVITITGNNLAQIDIGLTYNDLGATVTDNVDMNLGIHTLVGDTPIDQADIDTSSPATYHINYVATDAAGNTATSTRTVIVQSATSSPSGP